MRSPYQNQTVDEVILRLSGGFPDGEGFITVIPSRGAAMVKVPRKSSPQTIDKSVSQR